MSFSTQARNRVNEREREWRNRADSPYESAAMMCDPVAISRPRRWKSKAKSLLIQCTAVTPTLAKAHALLAYVQFLNGDVVAAEVAIGKAVRFDAENRVYLKFLLTILLARGKDAVALRWLRKLADLEGVDLSKLRMDLRKVKFPTNVSSVVQNAFPNGLGWFESYLSDEVEQIQSRGRGKADVDLAIEQEIDRYRPKKIDARKVPRALRGLIPIARKWGIGDDAVRGSFVHRASRREKGELRRMLPIEVRRRVNDWLDLFGDGSKMTNEAARFMYLLLAYEELVS